MNRWFDASTPFVFALGAASWTLAEYALHRWAFHRARGRNLGSREHLRHHATVDYFAPALSKAALAAPVLSAVCGLGALVASLPSAAAFTVGLACGWLAYEVAHRRIHVAAPRDAYGRWMRRHHLHHHGHAAVNHGVTTSLWDHVFGTYERPEIVRVPRRAAVRFPWLVADAEGTRVAAGYERDYRIV